MTFRFFAAVLCSFAAVDETLVEPKTEATFPRRIEASGTPLALTGADWRKALGKPAYALAHYIDPACDGERTAPEEELNAYIEADCAKALVFRGTYNVPARGIRWSWSRGLKRAGFGHPDGEAFVNAFQTDFKVGTELTLTAGPGGELKAVQDGETLGEWRNAELAEAVWRIALGEQSELQDRTNMARVDHLGAAESKPADAG